MSHKVTTLVYSRVTGSAHRKAVLAYMADRASDDGSGVWASKKTIANEIECGRSTVVKICNEFVAEGIILASGTRKCANGATVVYDLNIAAIRALPTIKGSTSGTSPDQDPSTSGTPPVHQRDPKGSTSGTQTTLEPPMNLKDTNVSLSSAPIADEISEAFIAYNDAAEAAGWPVAKVLSKARRSGLSARLKDAGGLQGWLDALARARASPLCTGNNERGWMADLDFLLQQKSFTRLMEGSYDPRNSNSATSAGSSGATGRGSQTVDAFASVAADFAAGQGRG